MKARTVAMAAAAVALARPPRTIAFADLAAILDGAIGGERSEYTWRLGAVSYRTAGVGTPLLMLHGIDAAASTFELRNNITALGKSFKAYAPDLLGFGLSERPKRKYTPVTYSSLITDFLRDVVGAPAYVLASSLTSAFAVHAAVEHPELVRGLILICPTGIERLHQNPTAGQRAVDAAFGMPFLGPRLFAMLISRPSIRYFLRAITYHQRGKITPDVVEAYHRSGERPGARWAPRAFVGGRLNLDISDDFAKIAKPILLAWGRQARTTPLTTAPAFLERNTQAVLKVFDNAVLAPHDEQADSFNAYIREWIEEQQT